MGGSTARSARALGAFPAFAIWRAHGRADYQEQILFLSRWRAHSPTLASTGSRSATLRPILWILQCALPREQSHGPRRFSGDTFDPRVLSLQLFPELFCDEWSGGL